MKILFTCLSESWGGMEMIFLETAGYMKSKGYDVTVLACRNSRIARESLKADMQTLQIKNPGYFAPLLIWETSRIMLKENFDIIHSHYSKDLWLLVPALNLSGKKTPLILSKQLGSYIVKKDYLHKKLYKRVDKAISISKVISQNLLDTCPLEPGKIELIHNWTDLKKFDPAKYNKTAARTELGIKENDIVIGMSARFSPGKGHEEFIIAAKKINKDNLRFMFVGEASRGEQEYADKIKQMIKDYGIEQKTIFTGYRSDMPEVLNTMDIFAFPSHSEAFGIALIEAMAMGKPSVATRSDGILDIAVDGETSLLFEKQNPEDLAEKLNILAESGELRQRMGKAARLRVENNFGKEDQIGKIILLYNKLAKI